MRERYKPQRFDSGTIAPLVAGYLALLVMVFLMATNVLATLVFASRLQGLTDLAVVYAHERSLRVGRPQVAEFREQLSHYLTNAPVAQDMYLEVVNVRTSGTRSTLELCAGIRLPLSPGGGVICRTASAESFLIP